MPVKPFSSPGAGFLVEALGIALLAGGDRRVDVNLDERQLAGVVQRADGVAVLAVGADEAGHGQ